MKLSDHIDFYHGGNVMEFARYMGIKNYQTVQKLLAQGGYSVNKTEIYKTYMKLPKSELDHVKKVNKS